METVAPGFSRPAQRQPIDEVIETTIAAACPARVAAPWGEAPNTHPLWGPWRRTMTGHATDPRLRRHASSGGALSALLIHALRSGKVDRVVHVAADPNDPTGNVMTRSTTDEEIWNGAGSRYSASSPLAIIDEELSAGGSFAFVGKPCDVSGLRLLALRDARVNKHVPIMLSFFCAGIPARRGADRILAAMGVKRSDLTAFRYRGDGWPGNAAATLRDGRVVQMGYEESWGGFLSRELQFRCKICPDSVGGVADLACADAWYGDARGYPSFSEREGRSLIISRTQAGEDLLAEAIASGAVAVEPLAIDQIALMQPAQAQRKRLVGARSAALMASGQPRLTMSGTMVEKAAKMSGAGEKLKSFLGALRRIAMNRR